MKYLDRSTSEKSLVLIHTRIDLFFGSKIVYGHPEQVYYSPVGISDHDAIMMNLKIPSVERNMLNRWITNSVVLARSGFMHRFKEIWNVFMQVADFGSAVWWCDFKMSLTFLLQEERKLFNNEKRG